MITSSMVSPRYMFSTPAPEPEPVPEEDKEVVAEEE